MHDLEIPLDQGGVEDACREAEKAGVFFAGLGPGSITQNEVLILQFLKTQLNPSSPKVVTPLGREIHAYILRTWADNFLQATAKAALEP